MSIENDVTVSVRFKTTEAEIGRLIHDEKTLAITRNDVFAELDFYRNQTDTLRCRLLDVIENDIDHAQGIARRGITTHDLAKHDFIWSHDEKVKANRVYDSVIVNVDAYIPTCYRVSHHDMEIVVKDDRGPQDQWRWAIQRTWASHACLSRDFEWEHQPFPSERDEDFFKRTRFTLDEAKAHCEAYAALPHNNS